MDGTLIDSKLGVLVAQDSFGREYGFGGAAVAHYGHGRRADRVPRRGKVQFRDCRRRPLSKAVRSRSHWAAASCASATLTDRFGQFAVCPRVDGATDGREVHFRGAIGALSS
ncbi:hypothetical protein V8E52_000740 [Russula decolorans]